MNYFLTTLANWGFGWAQKKLDERASAVANASREVSVMRAEGDALADADRAKDAADDALRTAAEEAERKKRGGR